MSQKSALPSCEKRWAPLKTPIEPPPRSPEPLRLEGAALARHRAGAPPAPKRGSGPPSSPAAAAGSTSSTLSAASLARPPLSRLSGSATAVDHRPAVAGPLWMRKVQKWTRAFAGSMVCFRRSTGLGLLTARDPESWSRDGYLDPALGMEGRHLERCQLKAIAALTS